MSVLLQPRWLALHAFTVLVVVVCVAASKWQFAVARGGDGRSLGYALQWPAVGLFGLGVWAWLCRDAVRAARGNPADDEPDNVEVAPSRSEVVRDIDPATTPGIDPDADPELAAYNAMLARLHEKDRR